MSDFDEEAERERLREQFEHDQKKREATEHMSELLLQGATMTDAHCETCGDPIFRYDGQEFCPTCQQSADEDADGKTETADETGDDGTVAEGSADDANASAPEASTSQPTDGPAESSPSASAGSSVAPSTDATTDETAGRQPAPRGDAERDRRVDVPALEPDQQQSRAPETGNLQEARDSLVATLSSFARQAEATDDPRRARDALEAAREAAETLAALDRLR